MNNGCRLSPLALGLSLGVLWALSVILIALLNMTLGYGVGFISTVGSVYVGYAASMGGILIGAVFALIDGIIGGVLIAWLYNLFSKCNCCCKR